MKPAPRYWLMKSEPDVYSIDDLRRDGRTAWTGVRNYQARNFMQAMRAGDRVLFYHSSAEPPGVAGLAEVCAEAHPDETQFKGGAYHEPRATRERPVWMCVDVRFVAVFPRLVTLDALRAAPGLEGLLVLRKGSRLSVQPVSAAHFEAVVAMGRGAGPG